MRLAHARGRAAGMPLSAAQSQAGPATVEAAAAGMLRVPELSGVGSLGQAAVARRAALGAAASERALAGRADMAS